MVVTVLVNTDLTQSMQLAFYDINRYSNSKQKVLKTDPLTENGIPEAAMLDVVLPRVKSAREGVEFQLCH